MKNHKQLRKQAFNDSRVKQHHAHVKLVQQYIQKAIINNVYEHKMHKQPI
jgi:hypothetical protein